MLMALVPTLFLAGVMVWQDVEWWIILIAAVVLFGLLSVYFLLMMKSYVAYKLKPIYSMVLSRDVHTTEIVDEMKDKHVENISEELTAWVNDNDKEISRLKDSEAFRKQYLGNVAHELKTPIFNIQGYISTLLDGGLEDELINRKYLERAEKSIDRLINIVNDLDTISKLENDMNRLKMERFDVVALAKEIVEQLEMEASKRKIQLVVKGADSLPSKFWVVADKHYTGQVLVNLIINAIHYGKEGGFVKVKFRDMLGKTFTVAPEFDFKSIAVYPELAYVRMREAHDKALRETNNPERRKYLQWLDAYPFRAQECDGQGRVLLPARLRQVILGEDKDVDIMGAGDHLRIAVRVKCEDQLMDFIANIDSVLANM